MGSRAGDADGDRRVLGDAACGDRGGGRAASGSATAWAMRKEMSRLSSGVFFGFGCFTGSGVLRPMAACRAAARHRQPRAALAPTSQRCRVGRVREALVCLIFESRLRPRILGTGFFGNTVQIGVSRANSFLQTGVLTNGDHSMVARQLGSRGRRRAARPSLCARAMRAAPLSGLLRGRTELATQLAYRD